MGALNVSACFASWGHLPHPAFRLLVGMALTALDRESAAGRPPRLYFGGEDAMCELIGGSSSALYRALATLRKEGAIEVADAGRSGHRAVYKLHLDAFESASSLPEVGGESVPEVGGTASRKRKAQPPASGTPRTYLGEHHEAPEGPTPSPEVVSPGPVDNVVYLRRRTAR